MNYYERHLGDYAKDTGHLSMLEHGAYNLLLDRYYGTEQGIEATQAHRIARARTRDEKEAVDTILAEFFVLQPSGFWTHSRVEGEIEKAHVKISAARENGKKGGRPKKAEATQEKPTGFPLGSVSETQAKAHQTPDTRHQKEKDTRTADSTGVACVGPDPEPDASPTQAGVICLAMKRIGIQDTNPGHPDLLALIDAGMTITEAEGAARSAVERRKGFAYTLGTLKRQRTEAAATAQQLHRGAMPEAGKTTFQAAREAEANAWMGSLAPAMRGQQPNDPNTIDMEPSNGPRLAAR